MAKAGGQGAGGSRNFGLPPAWSGRLGAVRRQGRFVALAFLECVRETQLYLSGEVNGHCWWEVLARALGPLAVQEPSGGLRDRALSVLNCPECWDCARRTLGPQEGTARLCELLAAFDSMSEVQVAAVLFLVANFWQSQDEAHARYPWWDLDWIERNPWFQRLKGSGWRKRRWGATRSVR